MLPFLRKIIPEDSPIRKSYSWSKAIAAKILYSNPSKNLKVIGITGTDGKTSTTHFTAELLELLGLKVAMSSTEEIWMAGERRNNTTKRTTLSPFIVQKFLQEAKEKQCDVVVLEVSSHAITQGRILGIEFDGAAVSNISQEHCNYHGSLENYAKTKAELFRKVKDSKKENKILIANKNMQFHELFTNIAPEITKGFSSSYSNRKYDGIDSRLNGNSRKEYDTRNCTSYIEPHTCHTEPVEVCRSSSLHAQIQKTESHKTTFSIENQMTPHNCHSRRGGNPDEQKANEKQESTLNIPGS
ncbi:hypothetical protein HON22_04530, partial [Candidatus Peregrinibacteria bacterium]|nr:hypothetical protein [Candidatus Peregrinibacteria bacterium]